MPRRLTPSPLAGARAPLDELRLRGWTHRGVLPLDGLLADLRLAGPDWRARLAPWLDEAAEVRVHGDLALVLFAAEPPRGGSGGRVLRDCAALGPCLPVLRRGAILSTAPFAEPGPALAAALRDTLVHVAGGRVAAVPLAAFAPEDVAGWWALDAVVAVPADDVPARRGTQTRQRRRLASAPAAAAAAAPFDALRSRLARAPRRRLRFVLADAGLAIRRLGRPLLGLLRVVVLVNLALAVFGLLRAPSDELPTHLAPWITAAVVASLVAARYLASGAAGSGTAGDAASPAPAAASGGAPRWWRKAAGWLAWHSPYRARLRRLYAERFADVERLFAAGRIDEALRKAIALSDALAPGGSFADLPLSGPGLRSSLEISFARRRTGAVGLDAEATARLDALYRAQASQLARAGDLDRAAFVLAELAAAPLDAVRLLADAGRFETAARLAESRRLGPVVAVPLWFKAGLRDRALALAARHDAFAELWKEVRPGDPFRDALAAAWAERLAAAGAFDHAAALTHGVAALADRRPAWIRRALAAADPPRPEALARALRALPWRADEDDPTFRAFAALLAAEDDAGAARRVALAGHLARADFEGGPPKPATPAFAFAAHGLARRLAVDEGWGGDGGHDPDRMLFAGRLAEAGGHVALRQHLRAFRRRAGAAPAPPPRPLAVEAGPPLAAIADAALLSHGRLLLGMRSGQLRLHDDRGRERWRGQVNGLLGFAALGAGDRALLLRGTLDGPAVLLFDPDARRIEPLGPLAVANWHPHASETGWLLFDGEALVMLDTATLLAGPASDEGTSERLAHHWRVPVSEPGRVLALADWPGSAALLLERGDGLIEWWAVNKATLAVDCRFWRPGTPDGEDAAAVLGLTEHATWRLVPSAGGGEGVLQPFGHVFHPGDRASERALLQAIGRSGPPAPVPRLAVDRSRGWAAMRNGGPDGALLWRALAEKGAPAVAAMRWSGSARLRTRFAREEPLAAVFDDIGRLVVLDLRTGRERWRLR